jgi:hypothetical protein
MTTPTSDTKNLTFTEAPAAESENGFPRLLAGFNAEYGHQALTDYLEKAEAPQEIQDLAEGLRGVLLLLEAPGELIPEKNFESLADDLAKIGRGLHFMGTNLTSLDSILQV